MKNASSHSSIAEAERIIAQEEMLPEAFVRAILAGESPLRLWRKHRGLSIKELAEKAGLSSAYISELETGKKEGRLSSLKALSSALEVDLDDIV